MSSFSFDFVWCHAIGAEHGVNLSMECGGPMGQRYKTNENLMINMIFTY